MVHFLLLISQCVCFAGSGQKTETAAVKLQGQIVDADSGRPIGCRLYIETAKGEFLHPRSVGGTALVYRRHRPQMPKSFEFHTTLSAHPFEIELLPGEYTLTAERGKEYKPLVQKLRVEKEAVQLVLKLERWIHMAEKGWYSGDTHVHRQVEEMPNLVLAEDLNVALPLTYWVTKAYSSPRANNQSTGNDPGPRVIQADQTHVIYPRNTEFEIFTVGGKSHTLGALFVLNHQSVIDKGVPPVQAIGRLARSEGALLELDKHNWPWSMMLVPVVQVDLFELANNHHWRTEFGFSSFGEREAAYMKIDRNAQGFTELGWTQFGFHNYYALLNCGFRMRPTGGTASGVHPVPLGFGRVYVRVPGRFSYSAWMAGLNRGRSFVTTGPMLFVEANGFAPGDTIAQNRPAETYQVHGTAEALEPIDRIEIVVNGRVIDSIAPSNRRGPRGSLTCSYSSTIRIQNSSWIAVRCFEKRPDGRVRFAHTAPIHIDVPGKPLRPRKEEVAYLVDRVQAEIDRHRPTLPAEAMAEYEMALQAYKRIAARAE